MIIIGIFAAVAIPAYQDYTVRAKIQEGVNVSNPHRVALAFACAEEGFRPGLSNVELGLFEPQSYSGKYVQSIFVIGISAQAAEITITFHAIGNAVKEGQTVVYVGTCRATDIEWQVVGSILEKYRPRI